MCLGELGVAVHNLRDGFANDDEANDDRPLGPLVLKEILFGQALHEAAGVSSGLLHVMQVVGQAVLVYTGRASASTLARNFSGKSPGVSRSTWRPSSDSNSS